MNLKIYLDLFNQAKQDTWYFYWSVHSDQRSLSELPFLAGDGEPGEVAIPASDDPVVAEDALEAEAELLGKLDRGRVVLVGGPLQSTIPG